MDDIYDLLRVLFGDVFDEEEHFDEDSFLEYKLYETYSIDIKNFKELIDVLVPMCDRAKSELTGTIYQGFGKEGLWLYRNKIN